METKFEIKEPPTNVLVLGATRISYTLSHPVGKVRLASIAGSQPHTRKESVLPAHRLEPPSQKVTAVTGVVSGGVRPILSNDSKSQNFTYSTRESNIKSIKIPFLIPHIIHWASLTLTVLSEEAPARTNSEGLNSKDVK
jgi:hypothetical protein